MKISLKYKIMIVMTGLPFLALVSYYYLASNVFYKDKMKYTMSSLESNATNFGQIIEFQISRLKTFFEYNSGLHLNKMNDVIKQDFPFLRYVRTSHDELGFWYSSPDVKKVIETSHILNSLSNIKKIKENTIIPLSDDLILYKFHKNQFTYYAILDFINILGKSLDHSLFKMTFYNPLQVEKHPVDISPDLLERITSIKNNTAQSLVIETENSLEAAYKTFYGVYIVSSIAKRDALVVLDELSTKTFYYFLLFISTCGILAVLITQKLTSGILDLKDATDQVAKGNYEIELNIKTKDEVEQLAHSFTSMSKTIRDLLTELRKYNEQLEEMVKERTLELNQALSLQRAMVDSLDEGFFIFDSKGIVGDIASKATIDIFSENIKGKSLTEVFELEDTQESFAEFCQIVFSGDLDLSDALAMLPSEVKTKDSKYLNIHYSKLSKIEDNKNLIRDDRENSQEIASMVCVVADKTQQHEMQIKLQEERDYVRTVVNLVNDNEGFVSFAKEMSNFITKLMQAKKDKLDWSEEYRMSHTYKAHANYIGLSLLATKIHLLEDSLQNLLIDSSLENYNFMRNCSNEVKECLVNYLDRLEFLSGVDKFGKVTEEFRRISTRTLMNIFQKVNSFQVDKRKKIEIVDVLFMTPIQDILKNFRTEVERLGATTDHELRYRVSGDNPSIFRNTYEDVLKQLIHLFRNSVAHGYSGHDLDLELNIKIKDENSLVIIYTDNGKGIDFNKLRKKVGKNEIEISDYDLAQYIFSNALSTADKVDMEAGRGVGLTSLKESVEKMSGEIRVDVASVGFCCVITLPLQTAHDVYTNLT